MNDKLLWQYLDTIGLPWQMPRCELAERYGVRQHPAYGWDVIEIQTHAPFSKGLLWPMSTQFFPQFCPAVPATDFSSVAYASEDARENLRITRDHISTVLGEGKAIASSNSIGHRWELHAASVELHVWPLDMQRWVMANPAHDREPRLRAGCHIGMKTGFQLVPSAHEIDLIQSFRPLLRIAEEVSLMRQRPYFSVAQNELEYVRRVEPEFERYRGWLGWSADQSTIIFFDQHLFMVPINDVSEFRVTRTLPAKGAGGSWLSVECECHFPGQKSKNVAICSAQKADDLNEIAMDLAKATGKPVKLMPYDYDV